MPWIVARAAAQVAEVDAPVQQGLGGRDEDSQRGLVVDASRAYNRRPLPLWPGIEDEMQDFGGLQIPQRLKTALEERGIRQPSGIQSLALSKLASGEHAILHAPTGGGKTLAYLIPMLARLQPTLHLGLQAIIFVPTPELALQITREMRWLFEVLCGPERVCWFNPQVPRELGCEVLLSRRAMWDAMRKDTAIIVTTPGIIATELTELEREARKFTETLAYFMCSNLKCIMLDEVDSLFVRSHANPKKNRKGAAEQVITFLYDVIRHRYRNRPVQMICASATANAYKVTKTLARMQEFKWPKRRDVARRAVPVLIQHGARVDALQAGPETGVSWVEVPKTITHCLTTLGFEDKEDRFGTARLELAARIIKKLEGTVLLFVPAKVKLDTAVVFLREAGFMSACKFRAALGLGMDVEQLADEPLKDNSIAKLPGNSQMEREGGAEYALKRRQELIDDLAMGERRILVAKGDSVRGIDLQEVRHVVLLHFPAMAMDYMHLAGRTGRMGSSGTVISIVTPLERKRVHTEVQIRLDIKFHDWDVEAGKASELPAFPEESDTTSTRVAEEEYVDAGDLSDFLMGS